MLQINFISNIISFLFIFLYLGDTFVLNEEYFLGSLILLNLILLNFFINIGIFLPYLKNKISELFIYFVDFSKNKFFILLNIFWNKIYLFFFIKFLKEFIKLNFLINLKEKINKPINFIKICSEKNTNILHFLQFYFYKKNLKLNSNFEFFKKINFFLSFFKISGGFFNFLKKIINFLILNFFYTVLF